MALGRARASLVIVERGWLDTTTDPRRYRLSLPLWAIRIVGRLLPQPDLAVFVDGSTGGIRNPDADVAPIECRLDTWRELAGSEGKDFVIVDGSIASEATLERALDAISGRLVARQRNVRANSDEYKPPERVRKVDVLVSTGASPNPSAETSHERRSNSPMTRKKKKQAG
jgi:hypothetical protein